MDEYIKRQEAIDALGKPPEVYSWEDALMREQWERDKAAIEAVPPADVRPVVRSHWKKNDNGTYSCERCHSWIPEEQRHYANWCLYCAADMRDGDAE